MIKVTKNMVKRFLQLMEENDEFIFGDEAYVKEQLQTCLNTQGYWSGCAIRVYYNSETDSFRTERRF